MKTMVAVSPSITLLALILLLLPYMSMAMLTYTVLEEVPEDQKRIGNLTEDAKLSLMYHPSDVPKLTFSFLESASVDLKYFKVEKNTGILRVADSVRLDRDEICPHLPKCEFLIDVAIGPAAFFRVININITILDKNDNDPKFSPEKVELKIAESVPPGTSYTLPIAVDPDSQENGLQRYDLNPWLEEFELKQSIGPEDGGDLQLVLKRALDREQVRSFHLLVQATDGGVPPRFGTLQVDIVVLDMNDNPPMFPNTSLQISIKEDTPVDSVLLRVTADDPDEGLNGRVVYDLSARSESKYGEIFGIDVNTGDLVLLSELNYEETETYHLTVTATDMGPEAHEARTSVMINVLDVNDNPPQITINTLTQDGQPQISEFSLEGTFVAHISATDPDSNRNGEVMCTLDGEGFLMEHIRNAQYKIVTGMLLDREFRDEYRITVDCHDYGDFSLSTMKELVVTVTDENDHDPVFIRRTYSRDVEENNDIDDFIIRVSASDEDIGDNGLIRYKLLADSAGLFKVDPANGIIRAAEMLDYETLEMIQFTVVAFDQGTPSRSASAMVSVTVEDQNDNPPIFALREYSFHVFENRDEILNVGVVSASDQDQLPFNEIFYEFPALGSSDSFTIDPHTGQIRTSKMLDREAQPVHYLTAVASNPGYEGVSSSVSITVYVGDENDNSPAIQFPSEDNTTIVVFNDAPEGFVVTRVIAHDPDFGPNSKLIFDIVEGAEDETFIIEPETGAIIVNTDLAKVARYHHALRIIVSDDGDPPRMSWTSVNIYVNQSLATDQTGSGGLLSGTNKTIVISLATASAFIVIVLVVSIIIVKSYDKRNGKNNNGDNRHNHIKIEIQRMLASGTDKDNSQTSSGDSSNESSFGAQTKDINFTLHGGTYHHSQNNSSGRERNASHKEEGNYTNNTPSQMPPYSVCHQTAVLPRVHFHTGGSVRCQLKPGAQPSQKAPDGSDAPKGQEKPKEQDGERQQSFTPEGSETEKGQMSEGLQRHSQKEPSQPRQAVRTHSPQPPGLGINKPLHRSQSPNPQTGRPTHSQSGPHIQTLHIQNSKSSDKGGVHPPPSSHQPKYSTFHPPHHLTMPNRQPIQKPPPQQAHRQSQPTNLSKDVDPQRQCVSNISHQQYQARHLPTQLPQPPRQSHPSKPGQLPSTSRGPHPEGPAIQGHQRGHQGDGALKPYTLPEKDLEIQRILRLLGSDQDSESTVSGDGSNTSNTDSGKGPSEEGEAGSVNTSAQLDSSCEAIALGVLKDRLNNYNMLATVASRGSSDRNKVPGCDKVFVVGRVMDNASCLPPRLQDFLKDSDKCISIKKPSYPTPSRYDHKPSKLQVSDKPRGKHVGHGYGPIKDYNTIPSRDHCDMKLTESCKKEYANKVSRDCIEETSLVSLDQHQSNQSLADDATTTSGSFTVDLEDIASDLEQLGADTAV